MLTTLVMVGLARADDLARQGKTVFDQHRQAIVTIQVVTKTRLSIGGRGDGGREERSEAIGTVIDPGGLTVVSLSAIDPSSLFSRLTALMSEEGNTLKVESELADVKIMLEDGTELTAEVVLRDRDLDLGFIRPKTPPAQPMPYVDLEKSGSADLLDPVVTLTRLGQAAGRAHAASFERIAAVVRRPRLFYVPDDTITTTTLGSPAFLMDGRVLGICVMRATGGGGASFAPLRIQGDDAAGIILPAADVLKVARQVSGPPSSGSLSNESPVQ
ncbi:MAG: trypsin-like peptidase domain-containing protein [Verrucomicrobiota bacterium]|nr:serine protease [Limisphaera sp.]MDW8380667.1 trypsin-like peptidase domain-containing protein [Verrucomicrobiota bacterium]